MKKILGPVMIVVLVVADQLFKHWIVLNFSLGQVRKFIPGVLSFTYEQNNGAAWSSLEGQQWLFMILTPIVIIVALYFLWRKSQQNFYFWGLILIISGALGNFIDRVRLGYVVDMIQTDFINFPIFNIADSLLTVGFVVLLIAILTEKDN